MFDILSPTGIQDLIQAYGLWVLFAVVMLLRSAEAHSTHAVPTTSVWDKLYYFHAQADRSAWDGVYVHPQADRGE